MAGKVELINNTQARELETTELINKMYDGAADQLVASILGRKNLSPEYLVGNIMVFYQK